MDVITQPNSSLLHNASLPLSIDTILRPVSLGDGDSFSSYFTGVDSSGLAGAPHTSLAAYVTSETLSPVLGQYFDQDILGDLGKYWHNFVASGQLWALLFGIVIGYMIRNLTAY